MAKIIYHPQYQKGECSNCSLIINREIEREEYVPDYHLMLKSIVHVTPCRCRNCGEYFSDVEIMIPENTKGEEDMQTVTKTTYICDFCKKEYGSKEAAWNCEQSHDINERLKLVENSIICPACEGQGWVFGNDGCDTMGCDVCDGKKIVIPEVEIVKRRYYKKIGS